MNNSSKRKNSSDPENFALREIFPMYLDDFLKDFSFTDIYPYINLERFIFTDEELAKILSRKDETERIISMFFILMDKNKKLEDFLNVLKRDYEWLQEKIENGKTMYFEGNKHIQLYLNAVHELRSHYPKHADFNVHRLIYFATLRDYLLKLKPRSYVVIFGELGFGKKWLALDVCCDYGVIHKMGFKIFWLDVHNCNSQEMDMEKLQRLKILLNESNRKICDYESVNSNKILELQQDIRAILKQDDFKDCLLVLCDVQNRKTLEAFNLPCKILITTRNRKITTEYLTTSKTKTVQIADGLTQSESVNLFEKVLGQNMQSFPENCNDVFDQSKGHPFLLNVIAQNLKGRSRDEWNKWIKKLEHFRIENDPINKLIELSLRVLTKSELNIYKTLSIFHHSVKIPIKMLACFWNKDEKETEAIVTKFDKYSLVTKTLLPGESLACSIHFLYYSYLQNCTAIDKMQLHKNLVKSYKLEELIEKRLDFDSIDLPNDQYFHYYIGFHLRESKMYDLFPKLYFDFEFLGQKLRATGLPNTIGDLKYYRTEITGNDIHKEKIIDSLLEFLPNIEEMMFKSRDTSLLQYALMANEPIHLEAKNQAKLFPNRLWFFDSDHFHRRRQMVALRGKPKFIRFIEPDTCIIALENNTMFLADLSLGYNMEPTNFVGHEKTIIAIEIFLRNYVLSLDNNGEMRIWSIADERRRSVVRKYSARLIANQIDYSTCHRMRRKDSIQTLGRIHDGAEGIIKGYYLDINNNHNNTAILYLALNNGDINIYNWNEKNKKFYMERLPTLHTRAINIRYVIRILNNYIILNNGGNIGIFNLQDGSDCGFSFQWPSVTDTPINMHHFNRHQIHNIIFVFAKQILRIKIPHKQTFKFLTGHLDELYKIPDRRTYITCSALSDDSRYLIIGTKQGIIIYDVIEKSEVLRNSISESISCIDVCSLDDDIFKYVIVSGSEGQSLINIFGLKLNSNDSITWANNIGTLVNDKNLNLRFEPNTWLIGRKLFDVYLNNGLMSLVAIDSKNRIHQFIQNNWSMTEGFDSKITAVTAYQNEYYIGCENGLIYNSNEDKLDTQFINPVTYLKCLNDNMLISSTDTKCIIRHNDKSYGYDIGVIECFIFEENYLILLNKKCSFIVLDIEDNFNIIHNINVATVEIFGSCDLSSSCLAIGTESSNIFVYKFELNEKLHIQQHYKYARNTAEPITCLAISTDTNICAVGLQTGAIEIYKISQTWKLLQTLKSHNSKIYDMKFSPWNDLNRPLILASISEQLCIWNITYIINNPITEQVNGYRRHSSRFTSKSTNVTHINGNNLNVSTNSNNISDNDIDENDANIINNNNNNVDLISTTKNVWLNKKGSTEKPELLSCIKFTSNKAEKFYANNNFTKFITIDGEGEIYFLNVQDFSTNDDNSNEMNALSIANPSNGNIDDTVDDSLDDDVII